MICCLSSEQERVSKRYHFVHFTDCVHLRANKHQFGNCDFVQNQYGNWYKATPPFMTLFSYSKCYLILAQCHETEPMYDSPQVNFHTIPTLVMKITISSILIGLKNSCFPLIHWPSCYRTVCYRTVQQTNHIQSCSLNQPKTCKVVV